MHIIVTPMGSAGDVHPFIGLALELQSRGHQVTMVVCGYFRDLVERVGLEYLELGTKEEFLASTQHPDLWNPTRAFPYIFRTGIEPMLRPQYRMIEERFVAGQTLVVASCLGFGARIAREKLGVPLVSVHCQPAVLWSEFESPTLPKAIVPNSLAPRWLRRWQYWIGETFFIDATTRPSTNAFRAELGLLPMQRTTRWWHSPDLNVCLFPDWYAPPQPDWPAQVVMTHFPLWDERGVTRMPAEVADFLGKGDPPIVFTPGSAMRFGKEFFQAAADACQVLERRGILLSRFPEQIPPDLPSTVVHFDYVPFSELLPHAAALVHHGGIGTTAQGLAAGVPQLLMPMAHDQPDNATRLERLGVGAWLAPTAFRGPAVARRLQTLLTSPTVKARCSSVAAKFHGHNGLAEAADAIERLALEGSRDDKATTAR